MPPLSSVQRAAVVRFQRKFKAAANTHGPLRCVLVHSEGEDFNPALAPPGREDMPALAKRLGALYSWRLYCRGPNGEKVLCKTATIGIGRNPYLQLDEPVSRHEVFSGRSIYLLRNHKAEPSMWPIDPELPEADPAWQELSQKTQESEEVFWRLAGEAGRCFGADDCGVSPGVPRESLEASDDGLRWLWIVFDLAWQMIKGSPLQAERLVWHEAKGKVDHFYAWELDFGRVWKMESKPRPGPDDAKRIEKLSYLKAWAERRPGFYYSSLDDLFSASVWAIDLLTLHKADSAAGRLQAGTLDAEGLVASPSDPAVDTGQDGLPEVAPVAPPKPTGGPTPNWSKPCSKTDASGRIGVSTEIIDAYLRRHPEAVNQVTRQMWQFDKNYPVFASLP